MRRSLAHLKNLLWHKYFVYLEGRKLGLGVIRLLIHDWDKFGPRMFRAYAYNFYNADGTKRRGEETDEFKYTWNRHQKVSKHHWQAHVRQDDDGTVEAMKMPDVDMREMLADWRGARRAYNPKETMRQWYERTQHARKLHPDTQAWIESQLDMTP